MYQFFLMFASTEVYEIPRGNLYTPGIEGEVRLIHEGGNFTALINGELFPIERHNVRGMPKGIVTTEQLQQVDMYFRLKQVGQNDMVVEANGRLRGGSWLSEIWHKIERLFERIGKITGRIGKIIDRIIHMAEKIHKIIERIVIIEEFLRNHAPDGRTAFVASAESLRDDPQEEHILHQLRTEFTTELRELKVLEEEALENKKHASMEYSVPSVVFAQQVFSQTERQPLEDIEMNDYSQYSSPKQCVLRGFFSTERRHDMSETAKQHIFLGRFLTANRYKQWVKELKEDRITTEESLKDLSHSISNHVMVMDKGGLQQDKKTIERMKLLAVSYDQYLQAQVRSLRSTNDTNNADILERMKKEYIKEIERQLEIEMQNVERNLQALM